MLEVVSSAAPEALHRGCGPPAKSLTDQMRRKVPRAVSDQVEPGNSDQGRLCRRTALTVCATWSETALGCDGRGPRDGGTTAQGGLGAGAAAGRFSEGNGREPAGTSTSPTGTVEGQQ